MSSPPPETETHDIELSRNEQWVVHHALVNRLDDAIDDDESPPSWTIDVLGIVESDGTEQLTGAQVRQLHELLTEYLDRTGTPHEDLEHGSAVVDQLEDVGEIAH